jgi:dTDP-glucose 4,6-dehydratase
MTKRLLLTGAGGFVGHHTLEHLLLNTDWEIICTDSFRHAGKTDRISEVLERFDTPDKNRVSVVTHDLIAPFSAQLAQKIGPLDYIISMASESHVDRSIAEPADFILNNTQLILNLLEFHRTYTPDAIFLQVSTDEVYGPAPKGYNHKENETHVPSNPYSASKSAQESIATSYWRTFGTPLIITNTMNIIGERQDPEKYVPKTILRTLNGETNEIHSSPEGEPGSRFYLHARNQADALLYLLNTYTEQDPNDSKHWNSLHDEPLRYVNGAARPPKFNVVGEREVNNLELAQFIASSLGKELKYELVSFHASRPGHDLRYALDGFKLGALGWKAPISLEDSLHRTVQWTLAHPEWLL